MAPMTTEQVIEAIDAEIRRLEEVKALLNGTSSSRGGMSGGGRRPMSAAGRARIAAAQKKRWAKAKSR